MSRALFRLDHLVTVVPNLLASTAMFESQTGILFPSGGEHTGMGTWNRVSGVDHSRRELDRRLYLELIARNPKEPLTQHPWLGLDRAPTLRELSLITWAVRTTDIEKAAASARKAGVVMGSVLPMSRAMPDKTLNWKLTLRDDRSMLEGGLLPFFIDWLGNEAHPAASLAESGSRLLSLRILHAEPERIRKNLISMGLESLLDAGDVQVQYGDSPDLVARIQAPKGTFDLSRSGLKKLTQSQ
jgi:hypothetical protein